MSNIFKKLERLSQFEQKHNVALGVIEAIAAVFSGAFIHGLISKYNPTDLWFSIIFTLLFVYLFYRRLAKEVNFSISGLGELQATMLLDNTKKEVERKRLIDEYIDDAIKALNSNTCNYNEIHIEEHLCDQSLQIGLTSVCQPYFQNPQNLLNSPRAKFTVGAYVDFFLKLPPNFGSPGAAPVADNEIFLPRDDFGFESFFTKDILTDLSLTGLSFIFQSRFSDTFRHTRFAHNIFSHEGKDYSLITAPIPTVCEDGSVGVLFIISEVLSEIPRDLENVSQIFCRLFANWLSRYDECISSRCEKANSGVGHFQIPTAAPQEVTAEMQKKETNGSPLANATQGSV